MVMAIVDFYCSRAFMAFDPEELKACIIQQIRRHKKSNTCNSLDEFTLSVGFTKTSPAFTKWQNSLVFFFKLRTLSTYKYSSLL